MNLDRIERDILINAPAERVWAKLVEFFWVDSGGRRDVEPSSGETFVAHSEEYGDFPIHVEKSDPYTYLSYRWASAFAGEEPVEGNSTLVEFTLAEEAQRTRLRVVESGFATLPEGDRRRAFDDNTGGWESQLEGLRKLVEA